MTPKINRIIAFVEHFSSVRTRHDTVSQQLAHTKTQYGVHMCVCVFILQCINNMRMCYKYIKEDFTSRIHELEYENMTYYEQ